MHSLRVCTLCSVLALCQAFQLPRSATQPRHPRTAVDADLLDSTLSANAEEFLGGIVGFLPLIADQRVNPPPRHRRDASSMAYTDDPGVLVGIPFLVFNREDGRRRLRRRSSRTSSLPGGPARRLVRKKDIDMSYAELEQKYGRRRFLRRTRRRRGARQRPSPCRNCRTLPGRRRASPKYEAPPSQPEEEFALPGKARFITVLSFLRDASPEYDDAAPAPAGGRAPELSLPSFPNPFGGGAPPAREPVFADEEEGEPAAEERAGCPSETWPVVCFSAATAWGLCQVGAGARRNKLPPAGVSRAASAARASRK